MVTEKMLADLQQIAGLEFEKFWKHDTKAMTNYVAALVGESWQSKRDALIEHLKP